MGRNFLIAASDVRAGKSIVGCALGFAFRARGIRVGVMKPAATGCDRVGGALDPADIRGVALASGCSLPLDLICPHRYAARLAPAAAAEADGAPAPDLARIVDAFRQIAAASDIVLVECAEGIADPITWQADSADLAGQLGLEAILVVANRPGCVSAARLTAAHLDRHGVALAGWILNDAEPVASDSASLAGALMRVLDAPMLGAMRYKEPLGIGVIEKLLARIG